MILVTGANGMTGRALVERLRRDGVPVLGAARTLSATAEVQLDLADDDSVRAAVLAVAPTTVVHLAGVSASVHDKPAEIYEANLVGTQRLLAALDNMPTRPARVILAGSAMVYGPTVDTALAETHALAPQSHYALSKQMVEGLASIYRRSLAVTVTRPFNYTSHAQSVSFLIPKLVAAFAARLTTLTIGNVDLQRDFSDLDDVVETYARLVQVERLPDVINICSGVPFCLRSTIDILERLSGHHVEFIVDPAFVRPGEPKVIVGDRALLDRTIGVWDRLPFSMAVSRMYEHTAYPRGVTSLTRSTN